MRVRRAFRQWVINLWSILWHIGIQCSKLMTRVIIRSKLNSIFSLNVFHWLLIRLGLPLNPGGLAVWMTIDWISVHCLHCITACNCLHGVCDNRIEGSIGRCKTYTCFPGYTGVNCDTQLQRCDRRARIRCHAFADCVRQNTRRCAGSKHCHNVFHIPWSTQIYFKAIFELVKLRACDWVFLDGEIVFVTKRPSVFGMERTIEWVTTWRNRRKGQHDFFIIGNKMLAPNFEGNGV